MSTATAPSKSAVPSVSVILPFRDASAYLERCLRALRASTHLAYELILVDDGSADASPEIARRFADRVITLDSSHGPAYARNRGAEEARGHILFFIDADVLCFPETLATVEAIFQAQPGLHAVIGSYDDDPSEKNFLSRYKNLTHHFIHQISSESASTFWTGCGAIRGEVFREMGGFDESYVRPSIEDIELGYRLRHASKRILLCKRLMVKHAKRWELRSLLRSDLLDRAIPWTVLQLSRGKVLNDLNLTWGQRASALLVLIALTSALLSFWNGWFLLLSLASLLPVLILNRSLYRFYLAHGGIWFCLGSIGMHWLYYLYSILAFVAGYLTVKLGLLTSPPKGLTAKTPRRQKRLS